MESLPTDHDELKRIEQEVSADLPVAVQRADIMQKRMRTLSDEDERILNSRELALPRVVGRALFQYGDTELIKAAKAALAIVETDKGPKGLAAAIAGLQATAMACHELLGRVDDALTGRKTPPKAWLGQALLLLRENPDRSDRSIAKEVGIWSSTLCRDKTFQRARSINLGNPPPNGLRTEDGGIERSVRRGRRDESSQKK